MTESEFATQVEGALNQFGWRWTHFRAARTEKGWRTALSGDKGFVDYVAVRGSLPPPLRPRGQRLDDRRVLFIEIKGADGKLDPEQKLWRDALLGAGARYYAWWPKDSDVMLETLR